MNTDGIKYNAVSKKWESIFPDLATTETDPFVEPRVDVFTFPFTNKEQYLAWRTEWRKTYRALSEAIREHRQAWRRWTSAMNPNRKYQVEDAERITIDDRFAKARIQLDKATNGHGGFAKGLARHLLAMRKASKVEAERQYQEVKQAKEAATL